MGFEKTKLNDKIIKSIIKNDFGINGEIEIEYINMGTANLFAVTIDGKKYVIKEYNSNVKLEKIIKEINVINFLKEKKLNVPEYLKSVDNLCYTKCNDKIITMQEFIEGKLIEKNEGDVEDLKQSAKTYGKLLRAMSDIEDLTEENIIENDFSKNSLLNSLKKLEKELSNIREDNLYKSQIRKDLQDKILMINFILDNFDFSLIERLTITNTHGDYNCLQLIKDENNDFVVLDFETAKKMPIAWEIIRSYSYLDKKCDSGEIDIDNLCKYFDYVGEEFELKKEDYMYAPYIYLIQLVGSTFGYKQYNNNYNEKKLLNFAFFRTNLCRNLCGNIEKYSSELDKKFEKKKHSKDESKEIVIDYMGITSIKFIGDDTVIELVKQYYPNLIVQNDYAEYTLKLNEKKLENSFNIENTSEKKKCFSGPSYYLQTKDNLDIAYSPKTKLEAEHLIVKKDKCLSVYPFSENISQQLIEISREILVRESLKSGYMPIHASSVIIDDECCVFFGNKNKGKSTSLFSNVIYNKANPVSGDIVFVKKIDDEWVVLGWPWKITIDSSYFQVLNGEKIEKDKQNAQKLKYFPKEFCEKFDCSWVWQSKIDKLINVNLDPNETESIEELTNEQLLEKLIESGTEDWWEWNDVLNICPIEPVMDFSELSNDLPGYSYKGNIINIFKEKGQKNAVKYYRR